MSVYKPGTVAPAAKNIPKAIQWHEGMLLAPQHFQQEGLRLELLRDYHTKLSLPYYWGVRHLDIDREQLVDGLYRVTSLEAVMPDGMVIAHGPDSDRDLAPLDLNEQREALEDGPLRIYLAVVRVAAGRSTVTGELARYVSTVGEPVVDLNTGEGELHIPRIQPMVHLFAGERPHPKYVSFPIAEVRYERETFALTAFEPARIQVPVTSRLGRMCMEMASRLRERAEYLSGQAGAEASAGDRALSAESDRQVHCLTAGLPRFEGELSTGVSHPYPLYLALCNLLGQVAGAVRGTVAPRLEPYDHEDPMRTFELACGFVSGLLEQIEVSYSLRRFREEDNAFVVDLPAGATARRLVVGVRVRRGVPEHVAIEWMQASLIGTRSRIRSMRERRILGAARQQLERDDALNLVPPPGWLLFGVEAMVEFIEPEDTLVVENLTPTADASRPVELVLYVESGGD